MSTQFYNQAIPEIRVEELAKVLSEKADQVQLVDVREPQEVAIAKIDGFENLPLSEFGQWCNQIHTRFDQDKETLVLCHHGIRSAQMCQWLIQQGFTNVKNVTGGIDAYCVFIDSTIPRY